MPRSPRHDRRALHAMLDARNEHPERLAEIDDALRARFEKTLCVMVLDMCGFSRLTARHGIIHFLALIRRMQTVVLPIIAEARGRVVRTEADNVFAVFDTVPRALTAATRIHAALAAMNGVLPADWDVHVGIGLGYGPLLVIGDDDVYGAEMNLASKLGEDTATAGQTLLSESAAAKAGARRAALTGRRTRAGSMPLKYFELAAVSAPRRRTPRSPRRAP